MMLQSEVIMLLLWSVWLVPLASGSSFYNPQTATPESTSIACEKSVMKLDCERKNGIIRITRANYGRFTLTKCNSFGATTGWNVSCLLPESKRIVAERCDGHPKCEIMASNDVFGDPCVNTSKYLQVYYTCEPIVYTLPPLTTTKIPTTTTEVTITTNNPPQIQVCDAIYFEDRNWPYTNVGEVASMSCIPPKVGRITWRCTGNGWEGERPDDSNCQTPVTAEESTKEVTVAPEEKCRLPSNVDVETISPGDVEGFKFGDTLTSRHEYVGWKSLRVNATIEIEFKTTSSGGIMLYATDRRKTDFISLIMKDGHLVFSFNCGSGALNLETDQKYNDGKWHTVEFGRNQKTGKISVDGGAVKEGTSPGPTQSLNLRKPFFVGGINPDLSSNDKVKKHLQGVLGSFEGCMRNMEQNYETFGQPNATQKVSSCVANLERGTFFNDQGGYITLYDKYYVGLDFAFNLDIRPRNLSGVILAIYDPAEKGDYIFLQLVDGKVVATADNGQGEVKTEYTPREENALCDGEWHSISVNKAKNVLLLTVDGNNAPAGTGAVGSSEINTNDPMYIGGVPDFTRTGILTDRNFSGCIRNFEIRRGKGELYKAQYLSSGDITGDVTLNKCPRN